MSNYAVVEVLVFLRFHSMIGIIFRSDSRPLADIKSLSTWRHSSSAIKQCAIYVQFLQPLPRMLEVQRLQLEHFP